MNYEDKMGLYHRNSSVGKTGKTFRVISDNSQFQAISPLRSFAVDVVVLDGFHLTELSEIVDCIEVLKSLQVPVRVDLNLVSQSGGVIYGSNRFFQVNTEPAKRFSGAGAVILLGTSRLQEQTGYLANLWTQARRHGRHVVALSEAVSALKQRGCFGDEVVCVHWTDPILQDRRWSDQVCDTTIFHMGKTHTTGAGRSSAVHVVLNLIEREFGMKIVNRIAEHLLVGDVRSTTAYQQYSIQDRYLVDDPRIVAMLEIMESEIEDKVSIADIAYRLGIGIRQLERLCRRHLRTSPIQTLEAMRMRKARWLVEKSAMPIIEISMACGFSNPSLFSRCFKRHYGMKPVDCRRVWRKKEESVSPCVSTMAHENACVTRIVATGQSERRTENRGHISMCRE